MLCAFDVGLIFLPYLCFQVKDLFKELKVECNVVELDLMGKTCIVR